MEINNSFITKPTVGQTPIPNEAAQRSEPAAASVPDVSTHTPSPELVQLMNKLRETEEVRKNILEKVAERMANGFYLTAESAEGTAQSILNASE